ncbi:MAG TPA: hypothetical protein VF631_00195, partial [Allosphingosinicella sp.]|uniref:hypothetical protein n=1 Tax=Allosphingosinicella sp. TaxID=2823234 RepID=UPI002F26F38C
MFRRLLVGGGVSLLLSMGGMAGGVLANLFLSRNLGASAFGTYSIALATAMITAIVCAGGLEASVVRLAPERFASGHGLRALSRYVLQVQGALHVAAAVFLILAYVTASRLFGLTQPWDVLSIVAIAFASARLTAQGMVFRAGGHFVLAQLYQHPIRSFLLLALVVAAGYVLGPLDPS